VFGGPTVRENFRRSLDWEGSTFRAEILHPFATFKIGLQSSTDHNEVIKMIRKTWVTRAKARRPNRMLWASMYVLMEDESASTRESW